MTPRRRRRAFTLIELVLSLTIVSLVIGAAASAVLLVTRAVPAASSAPTHTDAGHALHRMTSELRYALSIVSKSSRSVEFYVADRGHGAAGNELIRYVWSGTAGAPLERYYNGVATPLLSGVQRVSFEFLIQKNLSGAADDRLRSVAIEVQLDAEATNTWRVEVFMLNEMDSGGSAITS